MDREPDGSPRSIYMKIITNRDLFQQTLQMEHERMGLGTTLDQVWHNAGFTGQMPDLFRLFREVTSRGGIFTVVQEGKLDEVFAAFPEAKHAYSLFCIYISLLFQYEQLHFPDSQPAPSAAVESDKAIARPLPHGTNLEQGLVIQRPTSENVQVSSSRGQGMLNIPDASLNSLARRPGAGEMCTLAMPHNFPSTMQPLQPIVHYLAQGVSGQEQEPSQPQVLPNQQGRPS